MSIENEELTQDRQASKEAQRELTGEVRNLKMSSKLWSLIKVAYIAM